MPSPQCGPVGDQLALAHQRHDLVRLQRRINKADVVVGYVVAVGAEWVLVAVLDAGQPNGWVALPHRDITTVSVAAAAPFARRGLEHQRCWPPEAPGVDLTGGEVEALVEAAADTWPLVTIYTEKLDPSSCMIGRPVGYTEDALEWQGIDAAATWENHTTSWALSEVTRVDIGGQYERALAHAASLRLLVASIEEQVPLTLCASLYSAGQAYAGEPAGSVG